MKGRASLICLSTVVTGLLLLIGVVGAANEGSSALNNIPTSKLIPAKAQVVTTSVGLVTDGSGLWGFNWMANYGLEQAENDMGVVGTVYTPTNDSEYAVKIQECMDDGNDLCITVGWLLAEATKNAALSNPGILFASADTTWESYPDNLRGMIYAIDEVAYLAGTLAGLMTESDVLGVIGGMEIESVVPIVLGYQNGAQCSNIKADVLVEYSGNFGDPALGAKMAQDMIKQGADVMFAAAGGTGVSAILTATQTGIWGIGVDFDFYYNIYGGGTVDGADKLLSSAVKRIDNAVYQTIADVVATDFTSGTIMYDLSVDGVSLAPFYDTESFVPQSVKDAIEATTQGIIDGTIDVNEDCRKYIYLPINTR